MKEKILIVEDLFVEANYLSKTLSKAGYEVTGIARSVTQAQDLIERQRPDIVLLDIFLKGKLTGIDLARQLAEENIPFVYLSANSNEDVLNGAKATQPYGFLVKPFREKDLLIMLEIARYRHQHSLNASLRRENNLNDRLYTIIAGRGMVENKLLAIVRTIQPHIPFDYVTAGFNNIHNNPVCALSFLRIAYDEYQVIDLPGLVNVTGEKLSHIKMPVDSSANHQSILLLNGEAFEQICFAGSLSKLLSLQFELHSCIVMPLNLFNGTIFNITFYSRNPDAYSGDHLTLLSRLKKTMTIGIENILHSVKYDEPSLDRIVSKEQPGPLVFKDPQTFHGIVGTSPSLLHVFDLTTQVASSDTSVLILGESGTGKELVADCLHQLSPRKDKPFVKVNCAALPYTLIESELFGHEKGSFTGATDKRIGRFEKANKGTIFLDEIGEMPLNMQVKFLRVLQEKSIERIGARDTTKVDVRIIAATNRNLEKEVAEGRFRLDLYYRLNVFPIELPPLRERKEDITALVNHFINYYSQKSGKKITGLSDKVLTNLHGYHWPGNVRELENIIERSVLMAKGKIIDDVLLPPGQQDVTVKVDEKNRTKTSFENERDHIINVLQKCNGKIWGVNGAAEILNLPASTLRSKMKRLGIGR